MDEIQWCYHMVGSPASKVIMTTEWETINKGVGVCLLHNYRACACVGVVHIFRRAEE